MNDKGIEETNLPFWFNINDNEFISQVSSNKFKCNVGFEKDVEYDIDVEFINYRTRKIVDVHVYYKTQLIQAIPTQMGLSLNELYYKHISHRFYNYRICPKAQRAKSIVVIL